MGAYEDFNKIKTFEDLNNYIENVSFEELDELCKSIIKKHQMNDYTESKKINNYAKNKAELAIEDLEFRKYLTISDIDFEDSLELAEAVVKKLLELGYKERYDSKIDFEKMDLILPTYKSTIAWECVEDEEYNKNMNKYDIILLAEYILNNSSELYERPTEILISFYILAQQQEIKRDIESLIAKSNEKIQESNNRIDDIEPIIKKSKRKIKNINNNMITIMALFITAFSIIGINIYSLNNALGIQEILLVNSSLVFVLSTLMYMLDIIINDKKLRLLIAVGIAAVFLCGVLYFNNDLPKVNEVEQSPTQSIEVQTNLSTAN